GVRLLTTSSAFFKQKTAYEIFTWLEFRRVLFRSYVPIEEYLFFLLQTLLTGLILLALSRRMPPPTATPLTGAAAWAARIVGATVFLVLAAVGFLLLRSESGLYLGLILAWAAPVAAVQWAAGGAELVRH